MCNTHIYKYIIWIYTKFVRCKASICFFKLTIPSSLLPYVLITLSFKPLFIDPFLNSYSLC